MSNAAFLAKLHLMRGTFLWGAFMSKIRGIGVLWGHEHTLIFSTRFGKRLYSLVVFLFAIVRRTFRI